MESKEKTIAINAQSGLYYFELLELEQKVIYDKTKKLELYTISDERDIFAKLFIWIEKIDNMRCKI